MLEEFSNSVCSVIDKMNSFILHESSAVYLQHICSVYYITFVMLNNRLFHKYTVARILSCQYVCLSCYSLSLGITWSEEIKQFRDQVCTTYACLLSESFTSLGCHCIGVHRRDSTDAMNRGGNAYCHPNIAHDSYRRITNDQPFTNIISMYTMYVSQTKKTHIEGSQPLLLQLNLYIGAGSSIKLERA